MSDQDTEPGAIAWRSAVEIHDLVMDPANERGDRARVAGMVQAAIDEAVSETLKTIGAAAGLGDDRISEMVKDSTEGLAEYIRERRKLLREELRIAEKALRAWRSETLHLRSNG